MALIGSDQFRIIVGLGKTGLSVARYLKKQGLPFAVVDTREQAPGADELLALDANVECRFGTEAGELDEAFLAQATQLIVSPGISVQTPMFRRLAEQGIEIIGDIELFCRAADAPIVAITGSNAKSTVTTLVGEMAQASGVKVGVGGNIGTPALDLLNQGSELYVLELSSFQLETTYNLNAKVATVLNISADHLDRYDSYFAYQQSKQRIFQGAEHFVVNDSDALARPLMSDDFPYVGFALNRADFKRFSTMQHEGETWLCYQFTPLIAASDLKIVGDHNIENALAALALGQAAGLEMSAMLDTLRTFAGLKHRCQWVRDLDDVRYINDSKGTNIGATIAALKGLSNNNNVILIAGGVAKGADLSELTNELPNYVKQMIAIGECAPQLCKLASVTCSQEASLNAAVQTAKNLAVPGDIVLFSPACASFDMFKNFEHRGDCFIEEVNAL